MTETTNTAAILRMKGVLNTSPLTEGFMLRFERYCILCKISVDGVELNRIELENVESVEETAEEPVLLM